MKFYDRKQELAVLRRIREESRKTARFTVLTGRRRVGKTELIKQAYGADGFLYFFVARRKEAELCDLFASEVAEKLGVDIPGRFERVSQVIRWVMNLAKTREITLVIDEFQELQRVDAGTFSELQRDWDLLHNEIRLNLVVSGSINRLMNKIFKSRKEPLYGRQTEFIRLKPFTTDALKKILGDFNPKYTGDDLLALYAITGGVAKYVELLMDGGAHTRDAMLSAFFREESTFIDEAKICLSDEFGKDYGTYFTMLSSIAAGRNSRSEIEASVGGGEVGGYIRNLEREYELIAKSQPIFDKPRSKNSVYQLNDNFYMFWFRFVARHMYMIEIAEYLPLGIGRTGFEPAALRLASVKWLLAALDEIVHQPVAGGGEAGLGRLLGTCAGTLLPAEVRREREVDAHRTLVGSKGRERDRHRGGGRAR